MKSIYTTFENNEYEALLKKKNGLKLTWREFILYCAEETPELKK